MTTMNHEGRIRFGEYLRSLRDAQNLSQREVASEANISSPYLAQLERGQRNPPSREVLSRLAQVLKVTEETLEREAGYRKGGTSEVPAHVIERAFDFVRTDEKFAFGTRLKGSELTLEAKAYIVEVYQQATGRLLLRPEEIAFAHQDEDEELGADPFEE